LVEVSGGHPYLFGKLFGSDTMSVRVDGFQHAQGVLDRVDLHGLSVLQRHGSPLQGVTVCVTAVAAGHGVDSAMGPTGSSA